MGNGVVSVLSLWADELRYRPVAVTPYTPAQAAGVAFRAVVAESL